MGDRVSGHGFQDARVSGGTTGYAGCRSYWGRISVVRGAILRAERAYKGDNERRGCVQWPSCTGVGGQG
jgi:hypothetical protein